MNTIKLIQRNPVLKKKIYITLCILTIIRVFSSIPTPGVNTEFFKMMIESNAAFGFMNLMTGNSLSRLSVMALSISPYITASLVIQLLSVTFKKLKELKNGMKDDRKKYENITICLGGVLAFLESLSMALCFGRRGLLINFKWYWILCVTVLWTVFSILSSVTGKYISKKGIGNGISLILLTNILASYPSDLYKLYERFIAHKKISFALLSITVLFVGIFILFSFTYVLQESQKALKVNYSAKITQNGKNKQINIIPLKLCPGGVVPVIFASSVISTPVMIAALMGKTDNFFINMLNSTMWFQSEHLFYTCGAVIYIALIFGFSYFYTEITLNPYEIAEKIKIAGGNISGIRTGKTTEEYIKKQMKYMIAIGAAGLSFIAVIPFVFGSVFGLYGISFIGTSIIITVGVILESRKTFTTELQQDIYMQALQNGGLFHDKKHKK